MWILCLCVCVCVCNCVCACVVYVCLGDVSVDLCVCVCVCKFSAAVVFLHCVFNQQTNTPSLFVYSCICRYIFLHMDVRVSVSLSVRSSVCLSVCLCAHLWCYCSMFINNNSMTDCTKCGWHLTSGTDNPPFTIKVSLGAPDYGLVSHIGQTISLNLSVDANESHVCHINVTGL